SGAVLNPGSSCPQLFPVQDIEHTEAGWSASIKGGTGGSFTYTFTWTPPAAGAGNVTMYIAANSGTGAPAVTPTDVFTAHVTLTPAASAAGTTTTLTSSANPSAFGQNFSLSATVTPAAATGSVTFSDGSTGLSLGSATLINGTATLTVSQCLAAGAHPITAAYGGDSNDAASTSSVLSETINQGTTAPVLKTSGVVPLYSTSNNIEAGSWISLFGCNLYAGAASPGYALWNGTFPIPTNLGGVNVNIDGKPAFLWFASPSQINVQVPHDATLGQVSVNVTTAAGGTSNSVTAVLSAIAPSLVLFDATHVAGVIPTPDGSGHYGGGAYDLLGPSSSPFGFNTRPAKKGETVELFGVGFGPTQTPAPAGQQITASAITSTISATVGGASATAAGAIVLPGEYQVNVTIPANAASGDQPLTMTVGGVALLQSNLVIPVQ
ncbi:MAG TPA: Ig-like domain repeat protein, partial [Bryobacteraceae bacterium]|nr:Ig-like domain repeat protein [Bryobacteraceae bacterium]